MSIGIGSRVALLYGISFLILFFAVIGLLSLGVLGYILLVILGTNEGIIGLSVTIISFVFSLFYFGSIVEENMLKKRSLLYTSVTFSFSVNTVIWLSLLLTYFYLLLFTDQFGVDIEAIGKYVLMGISVLVAVFSIFIFSILTSLTIGLLITYRVKNQLIKSSVI